MKSRVVPLLVGILIIAPFALPAADTQSDGASPRGRTSRHADLRTILRAGQAVESLPPEIVVRVQAKLFKAMPADEKLRSEAEARGVDFTKKLEETWEFTSNRVHRVTIERSDKAGEESVYRRVESLPFDSKNLCKDLLEAKIFAIGEGDGGQRRHFAGTDYDLGHRAIELLVNGKPALRVGESCAIAGFAEGDALAFAALYEKLATQARAAFVADDRGVQRSQATAAANKGEALAALERKLLGVWHGGPCMGSITFKADGTFTREHYSPGNNTLAGVWSVRWESLPPTLVMTCKTSDGQDYIGKTDELKLVELNGEVLTYRHPGTEGSSRYSRRTGK